MDPETQKLLRFNQETKQIVEELLQIFQRIEKKPCSPSANKSNRLKTPGNFSYEKYKL